MSIKTFTPFHRALMERKLVFKPDALPHANRILWILIVFIFSLLFSSIYFYVDIMALSEKYVLYQN